MKVNERERVRGGERRERVINLPSSNVVILIPQSTIPISSFTLLNNANNSLTTTSSLSI